MKCYFCSKDFMVLLDYLVPDCNCHQITGFMRMRIDKDPPDGYQVIGLSELRSLEDWAARHES